MLTSDKQPQAIYTSYTSSITMSLEAEIKQWGNSLGIIIPAEEVKKLKLNSGDTVKISIIKKKKIDGFGMLKGEKFEPFKRDKDRDVIE